MRKPASLFTSALGYWLSFLSVSRAFSFSYTAPKSCDPLNVTWIGGTAPFNMLILPPSSSPRNVSIPDEAWNGTHGAFSLTTLDLAAGRNFVLTMSDATGHGAGGNSDLLTVGTSANQSLCNLTDSEAPFSVELASDVEQCGVYSINGYENASQPVRIQGIIPSGSSFSLDPPENATSYNWTVNIASTTRFLLFIEDAEGELSTVSPVQQVSSSDNSTCLDEGSPHSTLSSVTEQPTANPTITSSPNSSTSPSDTPRENNASIIGGSVAGGVALLAFVILLIWWIARRRQDPMDKYAKKRRRKTMDGMPAIDLAESNPNLPFQTPNRLPPLEFEPQSFTLPGTSSNGDSVPLSPTMQPHSSSNDRGAHATLGHNVHSPSSATNMAHSSTKAAMAGVSNPIHEGSAPPRRFVLHTDAGSISNLSTVELPPTYNAAAGVSTPPAAADRNLTQRDDSSPSAGG